MTLILSGTDGVSDIDGTAATPAIRGTDANTGIFFPAADTIAFAEGGAEAMRIDSSGNVGIGTTTPNYTSAGSATSVLGVSARSSSGLGLLNINGTRTSSGQIVGNVNFFNNGGATPLASVYGIRDASDTTGSLALGTNDTERMRIDSSGNVRIGDTTAPAATIRLYVKSSSSWPIWSATNQLSNGMFQCDTTGTTNNLMFYNNSNANYGVAGTVSGTGGATGDVFGLGYTATGSAAFTPVLNWTSGGNVGIGMTSPSFKLHVTNNSSTNYDPATASFNTIVSINNSTSGASKNALLAFSTESNGEWYIGGVQNAGNTASDFIWASRASGARAERARITSGGDFLVGGTSSTPAASNVVGFSARSIGLTEISVANNPVLYVNRKADDGTLVSFRQDGTEEGTISVSGNTVSYNGFSGGHWTQLPEGRGYNPEILRGTVMSSIGEMCEWKSVVWDEVIEHPAVPAVEAKEAVVDEEGNVIEPAVEAVEGKDAWTETIQHRKAYLGSLTVGATFEEDGVTKTVVDDGNERLPKVKISDVVGDKAVYGVFQTWDEVQDMLVTSLGAFVVRIAAGVTVQIGDLLESNGDGCAKVQDDDVIRSKTIGKVTSITPSATYDDGSYTVPCVIYCG